MALAASEVLRPRVLVETADMPRERWVAMRRRYLGASEAAAVAGLSPWSSALEVYLRKVGAFPEAEETESMRFGTLLEPIVADEFARRTGLTLRRRNAVLQHPVLDYVACNVDRFATEPDGTRVPVECKTAGEWSADQWDDERVPDHYRVQVLHQLAVVPAPHAWIVALLGGNRLVWRRIERDERAIAALLEIERRFWTEHVVLRSPPPAEAPDLRALAALYPDSTEERVALPPEAADALRQYREAGAAAHAAETARDAAKARLEQWMGAAAEGWLDGRRVCTWRAVHRDAHTVAASDSRTFRLAKGAGQ